MRITKNCTAMRILSRVLESCRVLMRQPRRVILMMLKVVIMNTGREGECAVVLSITRKREKIFFSR